MFKYIAALLLTVSCVHSKKWTDNPAARFKEPVRTQFYMSCGMQGQPITHCACIEAAIVRKFNPLEAANAANAQAEFQAAGKQCYEALKEVLGAEMKKAQEDALEAGPQESN